MIGPSDRSEFAAARKSGLFFWFRTMRPQTRLTTISRTRSSAFQMGPRTKETKPSVRPLRRLRVASAVPAQPPESTQDALQVRPPSPSKKASGPGPHAVAAAPDWRL